MHVLSPKIALSKWGGIHHYQKKLALLYPSQSEWFEYSNSMTQVYQDSRTKEKQMHHSLVTVSVSNQQSHVMRFNIDIKRAIIQSNGSTTSRQK